MLSSGTFVSLSSSSLFGRSLRAHFSGSNLHHHFHLSYCKSCHHLRRHVRMAGEIVELDLELSGAIGKSQTCQTCSARIHPGGQTLQTWWYVLWGLALVCCATSCAAAISGVLVKCDLSL